MLSIDIVNQISIQFSIYFGVFTFIAGIIGGLCNVVVFLSLKTFRENSCAFYLTIMSILDIGQLTSSLFPRNLNFLFSIDWSITSLAYCKLRMFFFQACSLSSNTCMCLAVIDQYLATCSKPQLQRYSSIKVAHNSVCFVIIIWLLHGIPILLFYTHIPVLASDSYTCSSSNTIFQQYWTYGFILCLICALPLLVTGTFGVLAYHNVSQLAYREIPVIRRETDKQLTIMVLIQVLFNFCFIVPYTIVYMLNLAINLDRQSYSYAQLQLARNITIAVYYWYFAVNL